MVLRWWVVMGLPLVVVVCVWGGGMLLGGDMSTVTTELGGLLFSKLVGAGETMCTSCCAH
jgi:hypothetical protein